MENPYQRGKIYVIECLTSGKKYYGSTIEPLLSNRLGGHRRTYKQFLDGKSHYFSSFEILEGGNYHIILVENYPCNSKDELLAREDYYIKNNECSNKNRAVHNSKEYYKIYRENNKQKIAEREKIYRENNKQQLLEKQKIYRENNKQQLLVKQKQPYNCSCGSTVTISDKARHEKTQKHQNYINSLENISP